MKDFQEKIEKIGVIPVIVIDEAKNAESLAEALMSGGIPCAEITFRTQDAEESIRIMTQKYPDMIVGAGTVPDLIQKWLTIAWNEKFQFYLDALHHLK